MLEYVKQLWRVLVSLESDHRAASSDGACVAWPVVDTTASQPFSCSNETVLFLGMEAGLIDLGRKLSEQGATVSFRSLARLQDIYLLPLEQYTMVILPSVWDGLEFDMVDIGGILRRADQTLVLVWASEEFTLSQLADGATQKFCDIALSLPASAENLRLFLEPNRSNPFTSRAPPLSAI